MQSIKLNDYVSYIQSTLEAIDLQPILNKLPIKILAKQPIYVCGNGGSASIAEHWTCDYYKGIDRDTKLKPNFISLVSNISHITAIANDEGYENIFMNQLLHQNHNEGVLIAISSSGNSKNIIKALTFAKQINMMTIALVGFDGGQVKSQNLADHIIHTEAYNYGVVEDCHSIIMHNLSQNIRVLYQHDSAELKL